jgi:metallo-beta-lactamase family protein
VRIFFHSAARTVTDSQYSLAVIVRRLLLECGLYQGRRAESRMWKRDFPFDPKAIDAMVLSHAPVDPCRHLSNPVKTGNSGPIHPSTAMEVN